MSRLLAVLAISACGRVSFDPRDDAEVGPRIVDAVAGGRHTCALASTGQLKCWGSNDWGILGIGDATNDHHAQPATLPAISLGARGITQLASAADFTCALLDDASVKCWGNNDGAQLGQGDFLHRGDDPGEMGDALAPVVLSAGPPIEQIAAGHYHTCVRRGGDVACWGIDDNDQNGYAGARWSSEDLANLENVALGASFVAVDVRAMFNSTCAVDAMGRMKCWGANYEGALGIGDTANRGDSLAEMGDALPFTEFGARVLSFSTGFAHGCAITEAGLKCWGNAAEGSLGYGDLEDRGDEANEMGSALEVVDLGGTVTSIACGGFFSCALLEDGRVKCWGSNEEGQLGIGDTNDRGDAPGELGATLPAVPLPAAATRIYAGDDHACALLVTGELACWGRNHLGQLGNGTLNDLGDLPGDQPVVHSVASLFP